jgi:hypothetical protein
MTSDSITVNVLSLPLAAFIKKAFDPGERYWFGELKTMIYRLARPLLKKASQ